jgi:hypothetical protein
LQKAIRLVWTYWSTAIWAEELTQRVLANKFNSGYAKNCSSLLEFSLSKGDSILNNRQLYHKNQRTVTENGKKLKQITKMTKANQPTMILPGPSGVSSGTGG